MLVGPTQPFGFAPLADRHLAEEHADDARFATVPAMVFEGELTDEDLAEDEEADVTAMGDFVDEDAEPEEPPAEEAGPEAESEEGGKKSKKKKSKADKGKADKDIDEE